MNNDNLFCEKLYDSTLGLRDKLSSKYIINKGNFITTATILPHGFHEVINNIGYKEYLSALKLKFKDTGQKIEVFLKLKDDGTKYVVLKLYSQTNFMILEYDNSEHFYTVHSKLKRTILFYNSKDAYTENLKCDKFYPASVSDFKYAPADICEYVFSLYSGDSMIWKDFLAEKIFPPIKLNELSNYHNKKEFFEKQFNMTLPNSVNKKSFLNTYAACCAKDYIIPEQIPVLFSNTYDICFSFIPNKRRRKEIAADYLKKYLFEKNKRKNMNIIADYIEFSFTLKEPIDIGVGIKKMTERHDMLIDRMVYKANYGKKLTIPETPLKYLKLPKEFILLKTKSALILEGERNHNCVGGYVDKINKGVCIIYTVDIDGEHLTIDIRCRKSRKKNKKYDFYVCQCYKSYNRSCKSETLQYVKECVENSSEKAEQKYIQVNNSA